MNKNPCGRCYGKGRLESVVGPRKCPACKGTGSQTTDAGRGRRAFMVGASALWIGAALGTPIPKRGTHAAKRPREVGPVDLSFYFLSDKPHTTPVAILADEERDIFRIRALHDGVDAFVSMSLLEVKGLLGSSARAGHINVAYRVDGKPTEMRAMFISAAGGHFSLCMAEPGSFGPPVWMSLGDVERAI